MSFLSRFTNLLTGGISGSIFGIGGNKNKKEDPISALQRQIQPLIDQQLGTNKTLTNAGLGDTGSARTGYQDIINHYKTVMGGNPDDLMQLLDASGETRNIDENTQQLGELGVRGGARAASLGSATFDRDAALNRVLSTLRNAAPEHLSQLYQALGNLGLGELSAAQGASAQASQNIFGITNAQLTQQQIHDQKIADIIGAIAGAAGTAVGTLCVIGNTLVEVLNGTILMQDIKVGIKIVSYDDNQSKIEREVIRITSEIAPTFTDGIITGSYTHTILDNNSKELLLGELPTTKSTNKNELVYIIKLQDELNNYSFITNGIISLDADCLAGD